MDPSDMHPAPEPGKFASPKRGCAVAFIGLTGWLIAVFILQGLMTYLPIKIPEFSLTGSILLFSATLLICPWLWTFVAGRFSLDTVGLKPGSRSATDWLLGLIFGLCGTAVVIAVLWLEGGIRFETATAPSTSSFTNVGPISWFSAIGIFVMFAGEEEIVGRGFLFPMIKRSIGFGWALMLSSLAFSLMHLFNPYFSVLSAASILFAGIFLALLRELTGNIYLAWGAHFGWNIGLVAIGLPVSGYTIYVMPGGLHAIPGGPSWLTGGVFGPEGGIAGVAATSVLVAASAAMLIASNRRKELVEL